MPDYTLPFSVPQRVTGDPAPCGLSPTPTSPAQYDAVTLPQNWNQQAVFAPLTPAGTRDRYILGVNTLLPGIGQDPITVLAYLHVLKSEDGGAEGTWAEVGAIGAKEVPASHLGDETATGAWCGYAATQDGNKIIAARFVENAGSYTIVLSQFDMDLDDWGADLSGVGDANAPTTTWSIEQICNPQDSPQLHIVKRPSDGHYIVQWSDVEVIGAATLGTDLVAEIVSAGITYSAADGVLTANGDGTGVFSSPSYNFQVAEIGSYINLNSTVAGTHLVITGVVGVTAIVNWSNPALAGSGKTWYISGPNVVSSASLPFTAADIYKKGIKITGGVGWNASWGTVGTGVIVGITHIPTPNSAIVVRSVYTSGTFPNPIGAIATLGATGGRFTYDVVGGQHHYPKAMISEFSGTWAAAVGCFDSPGEPNFWAAAGLIVGSDSRIHCFGWKQYFQNIAPPPSTGIPGPSFILHRTLLSDNTLTAIQEISISPTMRDGYESEWPNDRPLARVTGGDTEIIWPYLFQYPNGTPAWDPDQNCELRVLRFISADVPTLASEVISTGGQAGLTNTSTHFSTDTAGVWSLAINLATGKLYLVVTRPGIGHSGDLRQLGLFTDDSPWDGSVTLWAAGSGHPLGSVTASSYSGFVGIALTNGPFGRYEWDDIFYFELSFAVPVSIICDDPPEGTVGIPYSHFFPASDGTPPYTWSITSGALPDGLSLNILTGEVSGTPTVAGTFAFTIQVEDSLGATDDVACTITIVPALEILCDDPPPALVGVPYSHFFPANNGTPPYTWAIIAGSLPTGFSLDTATGEVTGTLINAEGTAAFTIQVTDSDGVTASVTCSIAETPAPIIECLDPPGGVVGQAYSHQVGVSSGTPPLVVSVAAGALPTGLSISSGGLISGTPTLVGNYAFTLRVTDDNGLTDEVDCSILIIMTPGSNCPDADTGGPG